MKTKHNFLTLTKPSMLLAAMACSLFWLASHGQVAANKATGNVLNIIFKDFAGTLPLVPKNSYTNSFGETYTVQKFRFYVTQILITDSSDMSEQYFPDYYFLVDAGDSNTRTIQIPLSLKTISSISFLVGVDSAANVGGTQDGALDPRNGMFWTWNTGYIMLKLQGKSPAAQAPGNAFSFDVGGYKPGENATRKIAFAVKLEGKGRNKQVHTIVINADANKLFDGVHPIKIAEHSGGCHEPGQLAMQLADNFATMFSLEQVSR